MQPVYDSPAAIVKDAEKMKLKSFNTQYGIEPLNKEQIDAIKQENEDRKNAAMMQYGEALRRAEELKAMNAQLESSNDTRRAFNPNFVGPGIRSGGVSTDPEVPRVSIPQPNYQSPKLEKLPDPKYATFSGSFPNPSGSGGGGKKGFISLNLLSGKNPSASTGGYNLPQFISDMNNQKIDSAQALISSIRTQASAGFDDRAVLQRNYVIKDSDGKNVYSSDATFATAPLLKIKQMNDFYYQRLKSDGTLDLNGLSTNQKKQLKWVQEYLLPTASSQAVLSLAYQKDNKTGEEQLMLVPGSAAASRPFETTNNKFDTASFLTYKINEKIPSNAMGAIPGAPKQTALEYKINGPGLKAIEGLTQVWDMIAEDNDELQDVVRTIGNNNESLDIHRKKNLHAWDIAISGLALSTFADLLPHIGEDVENRVKAAYEQSGSLFKRDQYYAAMAPYWYNYGGNPLSKYGPNNNRNQALQEGLTDFPAYPVGGATTIYNAAVNGTNYKLYPPGTFSQPRRTTP